VIPLVCYQERRAILAGYAGKVGLDIIVTDLDRPFAIPNENIDLVSADADSVEIVKV
jgi:hypothetical protein